MKLWHVAAIWTKENKTLRSKTLQNLSQGIWQQQNEPNLFLCLENICQKYPIL